MAVTEPETTPVEALGVPTVGVPATGARLACGFCVVGLTTTLTGTVVLPPKPSMTVTVNVSVLSALVAFAPAAFVRAVVVGV